MRKLILAISTVALAVSAAYADPIADRKAIMKERGGLVGGLAKMAEGKTPFDAAAVLTALQGLQVNEDKLDIDALFTPGSDQGDTTASPKIWEDMAGFKADNDRYKAALAAAVAAPAQNVAALGAQVGALGKECGTCHETFRVKKN